MQESRENVFEKVDEILLQSLIDWFHDNGEEVINFCERRESERDSIVQKSFRGMTDKIPLPAYFSSGLRFFL